MQPSSVVIYSPILCSENSLYSFPLPYTVLLLSTIVYSVFQDVSVYKHSATTHHVPTQDPMHRTAVTKCSYKCHFTFNSTFNISAIITFNVLLKQNTQDMW
jgi:hypothetical protein